MGGRWALYSAKSLSRNVGAETSNTTCNVIGQQILVLEQTAHHRREKVGDLGGNSRRCLQAIHGRKKSAEDIAHGVDEENAL